MSNRLACTEALYDKFMDLSFRPSHVRIGEFFETPRPPRQKVTIRDLIETHLRKKSIRFRSQAHRHTRREMLHRHLIRILYLSLRKCTCKHPSRRFSDVIINNINRTTQLHRPYRPYQLNRGYQLLLPHHLHRQPQLH